ncbi:MAG: GtrA family protein [Clostridia bacterium]|nr:GtrA family protein [Clostridia bacterium]
MKELFKKYREIIVYIIVGLMTTVVAYGIRLGTIYGFAPIFSIDLSEGGGKAAVLRAIATSLGWVAGVIFAFFTNKSWVFQDKVSGKRAVLIQFGEFTLSRLFTYFVEVGLGVGVPALLNALGYKPFTIIITFDADLIAMGISVVLVTILNYILSKLLVFKKKQS